ncbi:MAG: FKBP-type peptidyl-prolyl cis-trans isomerase [Myxococcales bacterium]|nr:FKBP-type peptidyl-prolyl cis-trans isomerase [Myxococcales bacterium]
MKATKIEGASVVTIAYELCNAAGEVIESSDRSGPVSFVHGRGAILPGLDEKIEGMCVGQEARFELSPEQAFGRPEDGPEKMVPRAEFPTDAQLKPGARFEANMPGGQRVLLDVLEARDDQVRVRMVHPLAGQTVSVSVKVLDVRPATPAELDTGRVLDRPPPIPQPS